MNEWMNSGADYTLNQWHCRPIATDKANAKFLGYDLDF